MMPVRLALGQKSDDSTIAFIRTVGGVWREIVQSGD